MLYQLVSGVEESRAGPKLKSSVSFTIIIV